MDVAGIQKRKFLNNIYKLTYSSGTRPLESDIRKAFTEYFSVNQPGLPIEVQYYLLDNFDTTDVDVLNELMANSLFNMEIMYDTIFENNQQLFSVVTALNNKLDGLRVRRKELEAKVDDILYANSNTDGYFYSFLENFNSVTNIDLSMTNAFVDVINSHVAIPKISNIGSDQLAVNDLVSRNVLLNASINSQFLLNNFVIPNFDLVFDGLNDTYWSYDLDSDLLGIASCVLDMPVNSSYIISAVEGTLLTSSPCSVHMRAIPFDSNKEEQVRIQDSSSDYSRFSFSIPADYYSNIRITFVKTEPDSVLSKPTGLYRYTFGLRELSIYSSYYDQRATLVSKPIQIPSNDNSNLVISSIALTAKTQIPNGTSVNFYVASDVEGATDISSFNWTKIESSVDGELQKSVQLTPFNSRSQTIDYSSSELLFIPLNSTSDNVNELNPTILPYSNKSVFRICSVPNTEKYITPFLLADINCYKHYNIFVQEESAVSNLYKSLDLWADYINGGLSAGLNLDIIKNQTTSINPSLFTSSSGILESRILCDQDIVVNETVYKSDQKFNLAIYLNNVLIADLPAGVSQKNIEWNFVRGVNNISITYDKIYSGNISFNLMSGRSITDYGTLFLDYFTYLDPVQFRSTNLDGVNVFTIDNIYGNTEIISSKTISNRSNFRYYTTTADLVTAVRYRFDLTRFSNPLQSPFVDAVRLKFKHNDADIS